MMKVHLVLAAGMLLVSCSGETAASLGKRAATAEIAYSVFSNSSDAHAATFMKAWVDACRLAKNDMMSLSHQQFVDAYVNGLKEEPDAAMKKPLQKYVRETFWKSGTGCKTITVETPAWALK